MVDGWAVKNSILLLKTTYLNLNTQKNANQISK
jgi:hypothetical protein